MSQRGIQKLFIFCSLLKGFYDLLFLNLCRWLMWIKYNLWDTLLEIISNRQKWVHLKKFIGTWQKTIESWTRKCHHALIFCHNLFIMNCLLVVVASVLVRSSFFSEVAEEKWYLKNCSKGKICSNSVLFCHNTLLFFIIHPLTFVLIKQLHGLWIELVVVYVCIFPCLLFLFFLFFSYFLYVCNCLPT